MAGATSPWSGVSAIAGGEADGDGTAATAAGALGAGVAGAGVAGAGAAGARVAGAGVETVTTGWVAGSGVGMAVGVRRALLVGCGVWQSATAGRVGEAGGRPGAAEALTLETTVEERSVAAVAVEISATTASTPRARRRPLM
jgi:hypothetical protein